MNKKHTYFRSTTAQQRHLLFETWETSGDVKGACRQAHVCPATFYYWKPRFEAGGYAALEKAASHAPKSPPKTSVQIEQQVVAMRQEQPTWGKERIADELAKANNWQRVISPNTVRRILLAVGHWSQPPVSSPKKSWVEPVVRTADLPGQTVNVDLCFVPVSHDLEVKLPAVSGSSGRLVVARTAEKTEADYPGRVFAEPERDYAEVMAEFVAASLTAPPKAEVEPPDSLKAQKQALRQEQHQLRDSRRHLRQQRHQEDAAWQHLKQAQCQQPHPAWKTLRQQRRQALLKRDQEDEQWRQKRLDLRKRASQLPLVTVWLAVLVIVDNCSRQCLGLPLFVAGSNVTADMVVAALADLLPPDLQFLISDRGVHFTAKVFQDLADTHPFIHVLIARHRPQSNGIAERFVRTLKEWLKDKTWSDDHQLAELLGEFLIYYNDRPHQSLEGLSPNEFVRPAPPTSS